MKKLQLAILNAWEEDIQDALLYIIDGTPQSRNSAKRYWKSMKPDIRALNKQLKAIRALKSLI